jgi:hypothetical protein
MGRSPIPKHQGFSHKPLQFVSLCGFSTPFGALSRASGQVSYVLRTRAPLSADRNRLPVRLACVRHAANVHPEPGSNSPYGFVPSSVHVTSGHAPVYLNSRSSPPSARSPC